MARLTSVVAAALVLVAVEAKAQTPTVTPLLVNGPDADKKVLVVLGDGYQDADMPDYNLWVQQRLIDGVFANDEYFRANHTAFNVYRVNIASPESGVTIRKYSAGCGTSPNGDDVLDTTCTPTSASPCYTKDTALDYVYTGCWGRCWMEGSANTSAQITAILDQVVPKRDFQIRVLNVLTGGGGGCGGGGSLTVTNAENWQTLAHELGHMVSGLYDEYVASAYRTVQYPSGAVNARNCSTDLTQAGVVWSSLMSPGITVPPATVWDPATMDIDDTVGMFEGCKTYGLGIYRPVQNCRMRSENAGQFCPVCTQVMDGTLAGFPDDASDYMFYANYAGASCRGNAGLSYTSGANVSNPGAAASTLICPTRRISDPSGNLSNTVFGEAFVVDRSTTADVCCQMFGRTPNGNMQAGTNVCTTGSGTDYQRLHMDLPKVRQPYTFAHYSMKCTLPAVSSGAASSILTYRIIQQRY